VLLALLVLTALLLAREYSFYREREQAAAERQILLQRIQAPEVAVISHASDEEREPVNGMPLFSDEDYAEMANGN